MIIEIKSKAFIEKFIEAGYIAGLILNNIISIITPGVSGKELNAYVMEECKKNNVEPIFLHYKGFPACICISKNHTLVHGIPNENSFERGDIISIDLGISIDGFIGDVAKTIVVKDRSEFCFEGNQLVNSCRFALWSAIQKARQGNKLSDISKEIEKVAKWNKFQIPKEYGGHGINRNILHASPYIPNMYQEENDMILRKGMVLAIEPMFIDAEEDDVIVGEDGWSVIARGDTAHFEHTILITDGDPLVLTDNTNTFYNEGYK